MVHACDIGFGGFRLRPVTPLCFLICEGINGTRVSPVSVSGLFFLFVLMNVWCFCVGDEIGTIDECQCQVLSRSYHLCRYSAQYLKLSQVRLA